MQSRTRRRFLATLSTGVGLLAGCLGGETEHTGPPGTEVEAEPVDHDVVSVRTGETVAVFRQGRTETTTTQTEWRRRFGTEFVATPAERDALDLADGEAGTTIANFLAETDFATESVMLWQSGVDECHEIRLRSVTLKDGDRDPHLDFCRARRPADVACDVEAKETVAYAVRFPIDGREINSHGSGMSSRCAGHERSSPYDGTVTVATEGAE
jgi:hypothetical protein